MKICLLTSILIATTQAFLYDENEVSHTFLSAGRTSVTKAQNMNIVFDFNNGAKKVCFRNILTMNEI